MAVVRSVENRVCAVGREHPIEAGLFGFAGEHDLFAADDLARATFQLRHLRCKLLDVLIKSFGPEWQPAGAALHETYAQLRIAVKNSLADHVHHGDHQLERKRGHVYVDVFEKPLAARAITPETPGTPSWPV